MTLEELVRKTNYKGMSIVFQMEGDNKYEMEYTDELLETHGDLEAEFEGTYRNNMVVMLKK